MSNNLYVNSFNGPVQAEWLVDDDCRDMRLLRELVFADTQRIWVAPVGALFNGASIPSPLWPLVGSPFIGRYRRAAVLHDYFCWEKEEQWEQVHLMFYHAMLADNVPEDKARLMWNGVYLFGPRWGDLKEDLYVPEWDQDMFLEMVGG